MHPSPLRSTAHGPVSGADRGCAFALKTAFVVASAVGFSACGDPSPPTMYPVTLRVMSDGHAMPGAVVLYRDRELGRTDPNGAFILQTPGIEGTTLNLTVRCPPGFSPSTQEVPVMLRSTIGLDGGHDQGIETTAQCPPSQRIAAVVVRTPGHPNLPIIHNGREITRTDLQGVAHMLFRINTGEVITLRIDTSSQPLLRPQNPSLTVTTRDADDVYVTTQNFSEDAPPRVIVRSAPRPAGPQQIRGRHTWMPF